MIRASSQPLGRRFGTWHEAPSPASSKRVHVGFCRPRNDAHIQRISSVTLLLFALSLNYAGTYTGVYPELPRNLPSVLSLIPCNVELLLSPRAQRGQAGMLVRGSTTIRILHLRIPPMCARFPILAFRGPKNGTKYLLITLTD